MTRFFHLSETVQAIWLFIYVLLTVAMIIGIVRHLSAEFHTFQMVLAYNGFAVLCFIPWLIKYKWDGIKTTRHKLYAIRAVLEFGSFSLSFYALSMIPLPMHTALLFITPIFGTIMAILILKEHASPHTVLAVAAGFLGVLIVTRPGITEFNIGIIFALLAAMGFSLCAITIKLLTKTEDSTKIAFYMLSMSTMISLPFGLYHWVNPTLEQWGWLAFIGFLAYSQQIAVAKALSKVPYMTVIPLNFLQLVFVSIIAYLFFNELIDIWTLTGAVIIIAGTLYNAYKSTRITPPVESV